MKNRIFLVMLTAFVLFTSSSCFITLRGGRGGRGHHGDRDYVEPPGNGMERASAVPLKFHPSSNVPLCNLDDCRAD